MFEITLPKAGKAMKDGTVVRWLKSEGQAVQAGEVLLEVETDRATAEVESPHSGTLRKILVAERATVPVGTPIALLGDGDEDISAAPPAAEARGAQGPRENPGVSAAAEAAPSAPPAGAVTPVLMPQVGNTMEEGTILRWRVQPGDAVQEGDVIFEVETDKANIEVEAVDSGRLARIVAGEGETVPIKMPVAYLADNDADVDAYLAAHPSAAAADVQAQPSVAEATATAVAAPPAAGRAPAPTTGTGRVKASPAARKLADQRGIDLASLPSGSGPGGRILSTDVPEAAPARPARPAGKGQVVRRAMGRMRRAIARNLLAAKQTIPHFYLKFTLDAGPLQDFCALQKTKYPCSINDFIVMACAKAVQEFPAFRTQLDGEELVELPSANIGIAVGVPDGLVVPVVVGAADMTLPQLASETRRIVGAARDGTLEGIGQGVFTLTNLGMFGIEEFAAIINPPEAAILAVGTIREEPVVRNGTIVPGRRMTMVLSCDHRIVDGLLAAELVGRLKDLLEWPGQLV